MENGTRVTVIVVTWNSLRYLYDCFESLVCQTYKSFSVLAVDNGSHDGTVDCIRKHYPNVSLLQNFKNTGYSFANNQAIKLTKTEYILIINPDIILEPTFLERIVDFADTHPHGGSFCAKLYTMTSSKVDPESGGTGLTTPVRSQEIDVAGLEIYKNRAVKNRGEGVIDRRQFENNQQVFGAPGCCVLYRKQALEKTKLFDEYFDESFFAYKEDVDLAWRLRLYGWESWYVADARGFHYRRFSSHKGTGIKKIQRARKKVSSHIRSLSFRNHHYLLIKNDSVQNIFIHLPYIIIREVSLIIYALFIEPHLLLAAFELIKNMPGLLKKRKIIMKKKIVSNRQLRAWFI